MSLRELWIRLTIPFRRGRMERELREELSLHLTLRAEQLGQDGLRPYDASLAARRRFGNVSRIADASRAAWGWHWLDGTVQDLRYVARQLVRRPGFALGAQDPFVLVRDLRTGRDRLRFGHAPPDRIANPELRCS